jgi:protein SCO1/2
MNIKKFYKYHFSWKLSLGAITLSLLMLTAAKWQWTRYLEKNTLVSNLSQYSKSTALEIDEIIKTYKTDIEPYTKVILRGRFDLENQQLIINRRHKFGTGSWLFSPFRLSDPLSEHSIMVSRGFIPYEDRTPEDWIKYDIKEELEIIGVMQKSISKRSSLSPGAGLDKKRHWLYPDLLLIQEQIPYKINVDYFVQSFSHPVHGNFPAEDISIDVPPSTHFWYTFEWILLALLTCIISFLIQLFRPRYKRMNSGVAYISLLFLLSIKTVYATDKPAQIPQKAGIIERSGNYIDLTLMFTDDMGKETNLQEIFDKDLPIIIAPVYFECPRLCTLTQEGLLKGIKSLELILGKDYQVLSVSFNHLEDSNKASERAKAYRKALASNEQIDPSKWKFLVGTKENVETLMTQIGFNYEYDQGEYMHAAGIIVLGPDGLISRYLYGIEFRPRDLKLALIEASEGKIGSFMNQALMFCFRYDHILGQYTLAVWNIIRVLCVFFMIVLVGFLIQLRVKEISKNRLAKKA